MGRLAVLVTLLLLAAGGLGSSLAPAAFGQARENRAFKVTFAARSCPQYTDVRANRARNDIMESLEDLGPDTNYGTPFLVNPVKEDAPPQSRCQPLVDWRFALGRGYETRAVNGPWGSLSKVTGPYASPAIRTKDAVDELDSGGQPTGRKIKGAVTVTLTDEQVDLAAYSQSLWTQGGLPDDPVLNTPYPGQYGFATLRCAIDAYNGDNVEWISFPTGATHVYCYAYYVTPPPMPAARSSCGRSSRARTRRRRRSASTATSRSTASSAFDLTAGPGKPADTGDLFVRSEVTGADAALGLHRARSRRLQARLDRMHEQPRQPDDVERRDREDGGQVASRGCRDVHLHEPVRTPAGRTADPQDDARRRRDLRLRRRRRHSVRSVRDDDRGGHPRERRAGADPGPAGRLPDHRDAPAQHPRVVGRRVRRVRRPARDADLEHRGHRAIRQGDRLHVHQPLHADRQDPHPQADAERGRDDGVRDPARRDALAQVPAVGDDRARRPGGARNRRPTRPASPSARTSSRRRPRVATGDGVWVLATVRVRWRGRAVLAGSHQADPDRGRPGL